jgi:hypothetical protein
VLALRRGPQPARGQALVQIAAQFFLLDPVHLTGTLNPPHGLVNT